MTLPIDPASGLPLPVAGCIVTQFYGPEGTDPSVRHLYRKGYHTGIDFSGAPEGAPVLSTTNGTVTIAGTNAGYGECVVVARADGTEVIFGHLCRIAVAVGAPVSVGQELGGIGTTGVSTGVHLHLEYRRNGDDIDPTPFLLGDAAVPDDAPAAPAGPTLVTLDAVNLRARADIAAPLLGVLPVGATVALRRDAYYPVRWNGQDGWVWGAYLDLAALAAPDTSGHAPESAASSGDAGGRPASPGTPPAPPLAESATPSAAISATGAASGNGGAAPADAATPARTVRMTTDLHLRAGPSTNEAILTTLAPGTSVALLADLGTWLQVEVGGVGGYVAREYVTFAETGAPPGFLRGRADLLSAPLAPVPAEALATGAGGTAHTVAETWNRYGGLLTLLAGELAIDPAIAVAVLAIEAGGRAFSADGRMIIRFENHIFYDQWGAHAAETFARYFAVGAGAPWQGHLWRPSAADAWREFHGDQRAEWEVLTFACTLDDTAAKRSISMGAPQIMGFNHAAIGYATVQEMFDSFSRSEQAQLIGFFDFVKGAEATSARLEALQRGDFLTFAAQYNGSGQAATYAGLIDGALAALRQLRSG